MRGENEKIERKTHLKSPRGCGERERVKERKRKKEKVWFSKIEKADLVSRVN